MRNILDIPCRYKQIDGYDDYYITECGDVYTYRNSRGWQGLRKLSLKGKNNPNRYLQVCLCSGGKRKYAQVHTLVAMNFCHGHFDGAVVNHIDGDIHNNHYTNLEWITQKENVHKSYVTSGINQVRNFDYYDLFSPDGCFVQRFVGMNQAVSYLRKHDCDVSTSYLTKTKRSRGYELRKVC